jgi:hypothetical protein
MAPERRPVCPLLALYYWLISTGAADSKGIGFTSDFATVLSGGVEEGRISGIAGALAT